MKLKRIEAIFTPPASHMVGDGFKVHQFIPSVKGLDMKRMDPFLMLDYNAKQHGRSKFETQRCRSSPA